jgi:hypothetical protein
MKNAFMYKPFSQYTIKDWQSYHFWQAKQAESEYHQYVFKNLIY